MINSEKAYYSELNSFFRYHVDYFSPMPKLHSYFQDWQMVMGVIYLMYEEAKGSKSKWYPYLRTLKIKTDSVVNWTEKEINEFQNKKIIETGLFDKDKESSIWNTIENMVQNYPHLFPKSIFNYKSFAEHWNHFVAYAYFGPVDSHSEVPYAEFLNHENVDSFFRICTSNGMTPLYIKSAIEPEPDLDPQETLPKFMKSYYKSEAALKFQDAESELKYIEERLKMTAFSEEQKEKSKEVERIINKEKNIQINNTGLQKYEKGSQIYYHYCDCENWYLASTYGFTISDNIYDYAIILLFNCTFNSSQSSMLLFINTSFSKSAALTLSLLFFNSSTLSLIFLARFKRNTWCFRIDFNINLTFTASFILSLSVFARIF